MKKITLFIALLASSIGFSQEPTTAPTAPPTRDSNDVISIYGEAYGAELSLAGADWDGGSTSEEVTIAGNKVMKITNGSNDFIGFNVANTDQLIDASQMTHVHVDFWLSGDFIAGQVFKVKLSNHAGAIGAETDAIILEKVDINGDTRKWLSLDLPLGSTTRDRIHQLLLIYTNSATAPATVYVDNFYLYNSGSGGSGGGGTPTTGDLTNWTFDDAASINVFNKIADAAADATAEINFNAAGNGTGAMELVGVNPGGAGKNYSYRYENANFDFKGNSEFKVSFDAKFVGNYVGAAFHAGIQVPNTSGAGVKQVNQFDLQGQINNTTWSTIEFNISDPDFNGSNGLFIFDFQIAAGAEADAGGTVLIDNFKLSSVTTASVDNNDLLGFSMYPNPAKNSLTISANGTIQNAEVFNVLGKKVSSFKLNKTKETLDVSNLATGIYLVKYTVDGKVGTAKFIKQ